MKIIPSSRAAKETAAISMNPFQTQVTTGEVAVIWFEICRGNNTPGPWPWLLLLGPQGKNLNYILGIQLKGANFFTVEAHSLTDDL